MQHQVLSTLNTPILINIRGPWRPAGLSSRTGVGSEQDINTPKLN